MKKIQYNIFQPQTDQVISQAQSWYYAYNENNVMNEQLTGSDGDIDATWSALTATDGTGGYISGDLVGAAILVVDGAKTASYAIDPKYNFASYVASVFDGATADPVNGVVNFGA